MRQEEFLKIFQEALAGKVSDRIIQENVTYYQNYMNDEIRNGKTQEEVLEVLGDPRLLAKTIEESNKFANGDKSYGSDSGGWSFQGSRGGQNAQEQGTGSGEKRMHMQGWFIAIIVIVVLAVVMKLAFSVLVFLSPVILAAVIGLLIYRLITGNHEKRY